MNFQSINDKIYAWLEKQLSSPGDTFNDIPEGKLASSRQYPVLGTLSEYICLMPYALPGLTVYFYLSAGSQILVDIDSTDGSTDRKQQLSIFIGYCGHFMRNEPFS